MTIIENYLHKLNEGKDCKDPSLPNPYDYQSLKLDPKVTKQDLKILTKWLKKHKKVLPPGIDTKGRNWLFYSNAQEFRTVPGTYKSDTLAWTIVDKGKRVGVVGYNKFSTCMLWASWVPGNNYATRGTMLMLDKLKKIINTPGLIISTAIYDKNIASLAVAKRLKMKFDGRIDIYIYFMFKNNWLWWQKKK